PTPSSRSRCTCRRTRAVRCWMCRASSAEEVRVRNLMLALILAWPGIPVLAGDLPNAALERTLRESFTGATAQQWKERLAQDEVQRLCSIHRNSPPPEIAQRIASLSQRGFKYPADGKLMG